MYLSGIISGIIFPYLTDKYGRKLLLNCSAILASLSLFSCGFCTNFWLWVLFLFIGSCAFGGMENVSRVYLSEISASNFRFNSNAILNIMWAMS